jgi:hypothetical protein
MEIHSNIRGVAFPVKANTKSAEEKFVRIYGTSPLKNSVKR